MPKISIITVNLNNAAGLSHTIQSVLNQSFKDYEYLIIDGGSTDGSVDIIKKNSDKISYWVSEPDKGIYNAMNKGIRASKGAYLLFLNSGDIFAEKHVLSLVNKCMGEGFDIYYGNVIREDSIIIIPPKKLNFDFFYKSTIPHQGTFTKKELFDRVFHFNENLKIVADWEFFISAICKYMATYKYIDFSISIIELGGVSSDLKLLYQEKDESLNRQFSFFIADYKELVHLRNYFRRRRFKLLIELENYNITQKLTSVYLISILKAAKFLSFNKNNI